MDQVRERRRRHGLSGDLRLRFSLDEEDRKLEDWIEFQAFHIQFYIEKLEMKLDRLKAERDELWKMADSADAAVYKRAFEIIEFNRPGWKYQEQMPEGER